MGVTEQHSPTHSYDALPYKREMANQKKPNPIDIPPVPREAIAAVRGQEDFVELLRRELEWPIPMTVERLRDGPMPPNQV